MPPSAAVQFCLLLCALVTFSRFSADGQPTCPVTGPGGDYIVGFNGDAYFSVGRDGRCSCVHGPFVSNASSDAAAGASLAGLSALNSSLASLSGSVALLNSSIISSVAGVGNSIAALNVTLTVSMAQLSSSVKTLNTTLSGSVTQLGGSVAQLTNSFLALNASTLGAVTQLTSSFAALNASTTGSVALLSSSFSTLNTLVSTLSNSVNSLSQADTTIHAMITGLQAQVNSLVLQQAGGGAGSVQLQRSCQAYLQASSGPVSSGYFILKTDNSGVTAYCDFVTDGGGWTQVFKKDPRFDLRGPPLYSRGLSGPGSVIANATEMMFAILDSTNIVKNSWKFARPATFVSTTPMAVPGCNYMVLNVTRLYDGFTSQQTLRYGMYGGSSPSSQCDSICHSVYQQGMICLKSNAFPGSPGGFFDFPGFFGYADSSGDYCHLSDSVPTTQLCDSNNLFAIFVR